jgi:hypothetical protein
LSNVLLKLVELTLHCDTVDFEICVLFKRCLVELFPALGHGFFEKMDFHLQTEILLLDLVNDLEQISKL